MNAESAAWSIAWWEIVLGGVCTLVIFSFLIRENPYYRFFEHLYIGIAAGIGTMAAVKSFIWPKVLKPLLGYDVATYHGYIVGEPYDRRLLFYLLPMAFGMLYYGILSRKHAWLAQLVIGFSLGITGGNAFRGVINEMMPQVWDSFRPIYVPGSTLESISNIVFLITLLSSMSYFFLTFKRKPNGIAEKSAATGRWMMMGCFGAFFGATIMARMALLVERLQFLLTDWWKAITLPFS